MRAIAAMLLIGSIGLIGGCDGTTLVFSADGQWAFRIEFNECPMPGFMKGGPSNVIVINVSQSGDSLSSNFQDNDGVDWEMTGILYGYRLTMSWKGMTSEGRWIEMESFGSISGSVGSTAAVMDGYCVVSHDSWGLCYNEQYGMWADINSSAPQGGGEPGQIIRQCPGVEICFLMDTSGSMNDEAAELCAAILQVESDLRALGLQDIKIAILGITSTKSGNPDFACLTDHVENIFGDQIPAPGGSVWGTLGNSEDWGPATALVAADKNWTPNYVRIIVPISDEGPRNGNSCGGAGSDDADSIQNAIGVAVENNVLVSPIAAGSPGRPPDTCVLDYATELANGTNGKVSVSQDPSGTFAQLIFDLIVDACSTSSPILAGR